jgi:DNA mismatch repair ATPase MutS
VGYTKNRQMIEFDLDKQTIKDLEIFVDSRSANSISNFYDQTKTFGGKNFLYQLMKNPITDINELRQRTELIQFISETGFELKINSGQFEFIEHYQRLNIAPLRNNFVDAFLQNLSYRITPNNNYYIIKSGVQQLVYLLVQLKEKMETLSKTDIPLKLALFHENISVLVENQDFKVLYAQRLKITNSKLNKLDNLFRKKYKNELHKIIDLVYNLDAFISIAKVAKQKKLVLPNYSDITTQSLSIEEFYHPLINNAVPYSIKIDESSNLCFLTGPNMAGKSTFLKSVGLSVYLAHIGFPIPAKKMTTTIYNGIVTTINLSDDINLGYSHFYSEVKRIKETILKIKEKKNLFVIFDELFRGTNVKDAFDGSLLIIESFANIPGSTYFISTHITEVAEKVKDLRNIQFKFFDSKLVENIPTYEYKLENGISHERLGMYILKNEKIIDILVSMINKEKSTAHNFSYPQAGF